MNSKGLIETFSEFKEIKNIDRPTLAAILEEVFRAVLVKNYGQDDNYDVIINIDKGDFEIWRSREVVPDGAVVDPNRQVSLSDAQRVDEAFEVGEEMTDEVRFEDFARRNILSIRQNLSSRIAELERSQLYESYQDRVGELISAEIYQVRKREVILTHGDGHELILPKQEQIPSDFYRKGETIRAVIVRVEMEGSGPKIFVSRASPLFLERLLEQEVPEIADGLITVKKVVRIPGERAKVAVESYDDRIDPVGACVGARGSRISGIVRELHNENIDVINYSPNIGLMIARALSPARITQLRIDEERKQVEAFLEQGEVSLAIGKGGFNIRLASQLTGYKIDVYRDSDNSEDDLNLEEFLDEIEPWVVEALKRIGCDTARSVLELDPEDIMRQADLEEETVQHVLSVLRNELE